MNRKRIVIATVAALTAFALLFFWWRGRPEDVNGTDVGAGVPVWTPPAATSPTTSGSSSPSASPTHGTTPAATPTAASSTARQAGCLPVGSPIVPTRITLGTVATDAPVLSLGMAPDGSVAAPPFDQPQSVGWYNKGPRPGSTKGKVVLTAHTFSKGEALGNALYQKASGLKPGDAITLTDAQGRKVCYRYTDAIRVMVDDYDPDSTILYDFEGKPMLALVICWDYEPKTKFWASRVIFYAEQV